MQPIPSASPANPIAQQSAPSGLPQPAQNPALFGNKTAGKVSDTVHFGQKSDAQQADEAPQDTAQPEKPSLAKRLLQGGKEGLKAGFHWKGLLDDVAISSIFALATCWLPGTQLFTIPAVVSIGVGIRSLLGFASGVRGESYQPYSLVMRVLKGQGKA